MWKILLSVFVKKDRTNGLIPIWQQRSFRDYFNALCTLGLIAIGIANLHEPVWESTREYIKLGYNAKILYWFITVSYTILWGIIISVIITSIRDFVEVFKHVREASKALSREAKQNIKGFVEEEIKLHWLTRVFNFLFGGIIESIKIKMMKRKLKKKQEIEKLKKELDHIKNGDINNDDGTKRLFDEKDLDITIPAPLLDEDEN